MRVAPFEPPRPTIRPPVHQRASHLRSFAAAACAQATSVVLIASLLLGTLAVGQGLEFESLADVPEDRNAFDVPPVEFEIDDVDFESDLRLAQQIRDPAIETVDEQTRGFSPGSGRTVSPDDESFGDRVRERWQNVRDPAIETVDEMTRKKKDDDKKDGDKKDDKKDDKKEKEKNKEGVVRQDQPPGLHAVPHQQRALERRGSRPSVPSR